MSKITLETPKPAKKPNPDPLGKVTYLNARSGRYIVFTPSQNRSVEFSVKRAGSRDIIEVLEADAGRVEDGNLILDGVAGEAMKVKVVLKFKNDMHCPITIDMKTV